MFKRIACLMTNEFEDREYTDPAYVFREAGHSVETIEKLGGQVVKGKRGEVEVAVDYGIDEVGPDQFDALFIPGGFSPDQLRADDRFVQFASQFMDQDKPVFAICHGPQLLITAKTLKDRHVTGYDSIVVDLENAGAIYHDQPVVVCHNLVTSRKPDDIPDFNRESLKQL
ncbi:type 1 glutamine amidotransferase domain-containing protein [Alkalibacillus salilacus]|uniref:Protease I n=1 Tax=Alkalibacillus salilacus TaxID=284582 RepID=A0ABT9VBW7_9BACI|nr:type 1 glutamine amidotransferase domain-containing protein [Alkalibacillus salilacus]MDQ0158417.1 protease I [Alkalibacillus salilacus]